MNGLPEAYANGTHVVVRGRVLVVTEHAPNAEGWRYHGIPADLQGDTITFSHEEATPVHSRAPRPVGEILPDVARDLLRRADLSPEVFDDEISRTHTPLGDLLETVAESIRRGLATPNVREAYLTYMESTA